MCTKKFYGRLCVEKEIHEEIRKVLNRNVGEPITITTIVDVMNLVGKCVVAGNVRRTAEIVFGDPYNEEYLDLIDLATNLDLTFLKRYCWLRNHALLDIYLHYLYS